ncbi:MAG: HypC/HybG/HupF family hydrogenase formation chaperone [Calditrichaeota bacterium]|nr:HypC/HybG/HupF family hydrogenase formation chaperone [Calditrichota bacterium]
MCLALPMKLLSRSGDWGIGEIGGVRRQVMLTLTPEANVGQYVIVHTGYAIEILDEDEAERTMDLLDKIGAMES